MPKSLLLSRAGRSSPSGASILIVSFTGITGTTDRYFFTASIVSAISLCEIRGLAPSWISTISPSEAFIPLRTEAALQAPPTVMLLHLLIWYLSTIWLHRSIYCRPLTRTIWSTGLFSKAIRQ